MKIGYGKLARSWCLDFDNPSTVGGDIDVARLLMRLANERPDDEFILVGRNQGGLPQNFGYPENVYNPWETENWKMLTISAEQVKKHGKELYFKPCNIFRELRKDLELDAIILWVGQVANSNSPIPQSGADWDDGSELTNPQVMAANYTLYLIDMCNSLEIEPILICPDPRTYWKPRELTRPLLNPILAQYNQTRGTKHEQYDKWNMPWQEGYERKGSQIIATAEYQYSAIELTALNDPSLVYFSDDPSDRELIGIISNENAFNVPEGVARVEQIQKYIFEKWPEADLFGKWTPESMEKLGREIKSIPYNKLYHQLRSYKCTMTFPASGSGWATAKPWEAFAVGTVMFFHKDYDTQGHIIPRSGKEWKRLRKFLIVHNQRQLWQRVEEINNDDELFKEIVTLQRQLFEQRFQQWKGGALDVLQRLGDI
jgi:hypothetical protein